MRGCWHIFLVRMRVRLVCCVFRNFSRFFFFYFYFHHFDVLQYAIPEFLKTGLVKIRAHFTTWQLKAIKSVQRPIKKPISDAEQ